MWAAAAGPADGARSAERAPELQRVLELLDKKKSDEKEKSDESSKQGAKEATEIAKAKIDLERALAELQKRGGETSRKAAAEMEKALAELHKQTAGASKTTTAELLRLARMKEELGEKLKIELGEKLKSELGEKVRGAGRRDGSQSRATYTLLEGKAEALAGFVKEHLKATVSEISLDGNKLTVTTTPEAQKAGPAGRADPRPVWATRYRLAVPDKEKPK